MIRNAIFILTVSAILGFGWQTAAAQITITIPKIPKIKKNKPRVQTETKTENTQKNDNQSSTGDETRKNETTGDDQTNNTANQTNEACREGGWMFLVLDDLEQIKKDFENYTGRGYLYTKTPTYDYLLYFVSPRARQDWLKSMDRVEEGNCPNFVSAFDKTAAAAVKALPLLAPRQNEYMIQNQATQNLLKSKIRNVSALKIFHAGVKQANWLIEKNALGIPTARYKHGMVWARNPADDHPYCHAYYINIVQDYAGGGTYGASYGNFVEDNIVPCPTGAK